MRTADCRLNTVYAASIPALAAYDLAAASRPHTGPKTAFAQLFDLAGAMVFQNISPVEKRLFTAYIRVTIITEAAALASEKGRMVWGAEKNSQKSSVLPFLRSSCEIRLIAVCLGLSWHCYSTGSCNTLDAVRFAYLDKRLDLRLRTAYLDHHTLGAYVNDLALEHLYEGEYLVAFLRRRRNGYKHQITCHQRLAGKILHLDDGHDLGQLLSDLLKDLVVSDDYYGHPAELRVLRPADYEGIDIKRPGRKHPGYVRQHTRFILD